MLSGKQKRFLRSMAQHIRAEMQIGKEGVSDGVIMQAEEMLENKELVKIAVMDSSPAKLKAAASAVSEKTRSEIVQIIGKRFILFRRSEKKQLIELPD